MYVPARTCVEEHRVPGSVTFGARGEQIWRVENSNWAAVHLVVALEVIEIKPERVSLRHHGGTLGRR